MQPKNQRNASMELDQKPIHPFLRNQLVHVQVSDDALTIMYRLSDYPKRLPIHKLLVSLSL